VIIVKYSSWWWSLLVQSFIGVASLNMDGCQRVFVTVGTTSFDKLIQTVSDTTTLQVQDVLDAA